MPLPRMMGVQLTESVSVTKTAGMGFGAEAGDDGDEFEAGAGLHTLIQRSTRKGEVQSLP